jgi:hypothetical protein
MDNREREACINVAVIEGGREEQSRFVTIAYILGDDGEKGSHVSIHRDLV